jgi:hypothetical protein
MPWLPLPVRPALAAAASVLVCAVFAVLAATREDVSTAWRTGWWALSAIWLVLAAHYARRAAKARGRHVAPSGDTDEAGAASSTPDESPVTGSADRP